MNAERKNDKNFLGIPKPHKGEIYVFDKGLVNYNYFNNWEELGVF
jgi:hypothetical protein